MMTLDFTISRREAEAWPQDVTEAFEERLQESTQLLGKSMTGEMYAARVEIEGDLWDAAQEYMGLEADLGSYGPVRMSERPLINGMGDPITAAAIRVLAGEKEEVS